MRNAFIDEGPIGWTAGRSDVTRSDYVDVDPRQLVKLPGGGGEHKRFAKCSTGYYSQEEWDEFIADISRNGIRRCLLVFVEIDGSACIAEGNHRLHAALQLELATVPVEIRYFGNSQRKGLIIEDDRLIEEFVS